MDELIGQVGAAFGLFAVAFLGWLATYFTKKSDGERSADNPPQPEKAESQPKSSDGLSISSGGETRIGGDVVGRDKTTNGAKK